MTVLFAAGLAGGCTPLQRQPGPPRGPHDGDAPAVAGAAARAGADSPYARVPSTTLAPADGRQDSGYRDPKPPERAPLPPRIGPEERPPDPATPRVEPTVPREPVEKDPPEKGPPGPTEAEPPPAKSPLVVALEYTLAHRTKEAVEALGQLDDVNRDIQLRLLAMVARLGDGGLDRARPQELATMIQQVEGLEQALRERAPLRMSAPCFCRVIKGFGDYEPIRQVAPPFAAAGEGRDGELVQVYVELSNFGVTQNGKGEYVAQLSTALEVRDIDGHVVWSHDCGDEPDVSRSPRRDLFKRVYFRIPRELRPGQYTLWVCVQDVLTKPPRPPARRSLDFRVIAQGPVTGPQNGPGLAFK